MKLNLLKAFAVAAILALPAAGIANEPGSTERFESLDRNGDGFVSRDEGKDAEELNTRFTELDRNNDNKLSRQEYGALEEEARAAAEKAAAAAGGTTGKPRVKEARK
ncbi:MAG TPA: hypothetical protein VFK84_12450 [Burkholderiales bacterium]|nr:hypothetical protein [Burkholderiales bacterium]